MFWAIHPASGFDLVTGTVLRNDPVRSQLFQEECLLKGVYPSHSGSYRLLVSSAIPIEASTDKQSDLFSYDYFVFYVMVYGTANNHVSG